MVAALASALIIFHKHESLFLGFGLYDKIYIFLPNNLCDCSSNVIQSFTYALNFISGDTARFKFGFDKFVELLGGELLFRQPESRLRAFRQSLVCFYSLPEMLKSTELWQVN